MCVTGENLVTGDAEIGRFPYISTQFETRKSNEQNATATKTSKVHV